ncbi:MAG: M15 family metallopeptidase [Rikenellaceae bacterium]
MALDSVFIEYEYDRRGLLDISLVDPTIEVDLKYSTDNNFVGRNLYGDLRKAYLHPEVIDMLVRSHELLKQALPNHRFLIYDAARPISIQKSMYDLVKGGEYEKYVANPYRESAGYHNYGLAVDLTIIDSNGVALDMGSDFDSFSRVSHSNNDELLLSKGYISQDTLNNRAILRSVMLAPNFHQNPFEWWHFQLDFGVNIPSQYHVLDF